MIPASIPADEAARLQVLAELKLLDTDADPVLDGLVASAACALGCPAALVTLVDCDRQWFKARVGVGAAQTPRELSFCAHAILGDGLFEVPDMTGDPRFADNPFVVGGPQARFYAGVPLTVAGHKVGTLCVIDRVPRRLDAAQRALLIALARAVEHWMQSWREHHQLREMQGFIADVARLVPGMFFQYRLADGGAARFPYSSDGIQALYELSPQDVHSDAAALFERLHANDRAEVHGAMDRSARMLTPWYQQYRVQLPERGERWLEAHAMPQRTDDGAVQWHGFMQDITHRREFELATREKLASERANQAKTEFLGRFSHELRTPLNAVLGFTQLMKTDAQLPEHTQGHLRHVEDAGRHLLELVDDILDLTRIERGLHPLAIGSVAVADVLASSVAMIEPLARQRAIRFTSVHGGTRAVVRADARAFGQVLLNVLSNAVKYNRDQGVVWLEVRSVGAEVAICVGDEGSGLSPAQRQRLFQPFDRLGAELGQVQGSGLGLVISKQLIEAMQGRLEVHDRPEGGCRFEIWLAAASPLPTPRQHRRHTDVRPAMPVEPAASDPLALCVDDDPVNVVLLQELIAIKGGWRVLVAPDGEAALRLAKLHRPELLISDTHMPGMDGLTLVKAVRTDPALCATRCIAVSGDAMAEARDRALDAGYDAYLTKPLDAALLHRAIERFERR